MWSAEDNYHEIMGIKEVEERISFGKAQKKTHPEMGDGVDTERPLDHLVRSVQQSPSRGHPGVVDQQGDLRNGKGINFFSLANELIRLQIANCFSSNKWRRSRWWCHYSIVIDSR